MERAGPTNRGFAGPDNDAAAATDPNLRSSMLTTAVVTACVVLVWLTRSFLAEVAAQDELLPGLSLGAVT